MEGGGGGAYGSRQTTCPIQAVGLQMCFIKDCCYIKKLYQDYILYNNKEVLFCKMSDSCAPLGNQQPQFLPLMHQHYIHVTQENILGMFEKARRTFNSTYRCCEGILRIVKDSCNHLDEKK